MTTASHQEPNYMAVFWTLLTFTLIEVGIFYLHIARVFYITALILLALIKAFLVAGYFMHLMSERKTIYAILAATAFFFVGLMYLVVWARDQMPHGTAYWGNPVKPGEPAAKTGH